MSLIEDDVWNKRSRNKIDVKFETKERAKVCLTNSWLPPPTKAQTSCETNDTSFRPTPATIGIKLINNDSRPMQRDNESYRQRK